MDPPLHSFFALSTISFRNDFHSFEELYLFSHTNLHCYFSHSGLRIFPNLYVRLNTFLRRCVSSFESHCYPFHILYIYFQRYVLYTVYILSDTHLPLHLVCVINFYLSVQPRSDSFIYLCAFPVAIFYVQSLSIDMCFES